MEKMMCAADAWRALNIRSGFDVKRSTFFRYVSDGRIPSVKVGDRKVMVKGSDIDKFIAKVSA